MRSLLPGILACMVVVGALPLRAANPDAPASQAPVASSTSPAADAELSSTDRAFFEEHVRLCW